MCMLHFLNPFIHQWTLGLLQAIDYQKYCCCELGHKHISLSPCFQLFWFYMQKWNFLQKGISKNIILMSKNLLSVFSSRSSVVLDLTFKSLINFDFTFVHAVRELSSLIILQELSRFSNIIYWKYCLFPIVYCCFLCNWLIAHLSVSSVLGSLFCCIDHCIYFCASTILFWCLELCSILWTQAAYHF